MEQEPLTWAQIRESARKVLAPRCAVCPECNGRVCAGKVPGPGGKGSGLTFQRNYDFLKQHVKLQMNATGTPFTADTKIELFGKELSLPVLTAPIGMVALSLSPALNEYTYACAILDGMAQSGSLAITGGGAGPNSFYDPLRAITERHGAGIPNLKPWGLDVIREHVKEIEAAGVPAFVIDVDSAGLPHAVHANPPLVRKSVEDLAEIAAMTDIPFVVKGVMTPDVAKSLVGSGVYGIDVSNHGGRVMDEGLSTAEVLPAIKEAVGDSMKVFVDGGVRTGLDVFKMLALGADAVFIGRPYITAAYGGGAEGVHVYTEKVRTELIDAMNMCGCPTLKDIHRDNIAIV